MSFRVGRGLETGVSLFFLLSVVLVTRVVCAVGVCLCVCLCACVCGVCMCFSLCVSVCVCVCVNMYVGVCVIHDVWQGELLNYWCMERVFDTRVCCACSELDISGVRSKL